MLDKLKDYSIVYSFDKTGYERHAKQFSALNSVKFAGKHFLVTGGTRGIGEAVAKGMLEMGAKVTVTARSSKDFDINFKDAANAAFIDLDLADFEHILHQDYGYYDGIVLNAGGMPSELHVINNQFDTIFASQVAGHFVLLKHLIESRRLKPQSSVHWVASGGMYMQKLDLSDLAWQHKTYDKVKSYANAKRSQVILNGMLAQRYKGFVFSCSHPGWVGTAALAEALPDFTKKLGKRLRTAEQGADTILWCLEQGLNLKSGLFWFDRKPRQTAPFFWTRETEADRLDLWKLMESVWEDAQSLPVKAEMSVN